MFTQGKWEAVHGEDNAANYSKSHPDCITIRADGWNIARIWTDGEHYKESAEANAEFICKAVNSHTELLEACKWLLKAYKGMLKEADIHFKKGQIPGITQAEDIIAKAE